MGQARYRARISSKGRIVLPREVREKYGYQNGSELIITPVGKGRLLLERVPWLSELLGFLDDIEAGGR
ncbi:MAG: AbrB/MazE/SpoVT family DNA-binding domain-containing protein [Candidatus Bathyarchaeia archaeon]